MKAPDGCCARRNGRGKRDGTLSETELAPTTTAMATSAAATAAESMAEGRANGHKHKKEGQRMDVNHPCG